MIQHHQSVATAPRIPANVLSARICIGCTEPMDPARPANARHCKPCYRTYRASPEFKAKQNAAAQKWRALHREAHHAANRRWYENNIERSNAKAARWRAANPDKIKAKDRRRYARLKAERAPLVAARLAALAERRAAKAAEKAARAAAREARRTAKAATKERTRIERSRTVVAWQAGASLDLAAINAAVPRGLPGRDDVCQSLALAMLEGTITRDNLAAHVRKHVAAFNRDNFEGRGFAVSLSEPRRDGRTWDDVLADFNEGARL